jgi:PPOX class probable F420-dependent enzyme
VTDLATFARIASHERGLCVVTTVRHDSTVQASVVNVGVLADPTGGRDLVGFVARGDAHKLANLRRRPQVTVVARAGWEWCAVEGTAELVGPDDPHPAIEANDLPQLLRDVFIAAGGQHDDWATYDRVMAEERRTAVLVRVTRTYSNAVG